MMARMRSSDVRDNLTEGFEPAAFAAGPDGAIAPPSKTPPRPPPRLCQQGPCVHYHTFALPFDAETPKGGSIEAGGKITGDAGPAPVYTEVHHYCYPTAGVEMNLGGLPVLRCNRWDPMEMALDVAAREERRQAFLSSVPGQIYERELAEWRAQSQSDEADEQTEAPIERVLVYTAPDAPLEIAVGPSTSLWDVLLRALGVDVEQPDLDIGIYAGWRLLDGDGGELTNLDATLAEIGARDGERFFLHNTKG